MSIDSKILASLLRGRIRRLFFSSYILVEIAKDV